MDTKAVAITQASTLKIERISSGIAELDQMLGGGYVLSASYLIGGEPGIGKSSALLASVSHTSRQGFNTLYITTEETIGQVADRAKRFNALNDKLFVYATNDLD